VQHEDYNVGLSNCDHRTAQPLTWNRGFAAQQEQPHPGAQGWLRVSHRELDPKRSTPSEPFLTHRREQLLKLKQSVPVEIGIWAQAESWTKPRRIVAKVEHHEGELFPRVGFIVTSLSLHSRAVVRFYNKRGTAEQWIKEGKQATHWTRLSCHRFRANEARLQLSLLAYNLGNLWRRLVLPKRIDAWSLTSLQQRIVKTGRRLIKHAWYYWLLLAEGHLHRRLFGQMLRRICALPVPSG
jgi:hypothetical protein